MLLQILTHTPHWVFAVFALLLWLGARQWVAGSVGLGRVTVMPIVMTGLSVYGVLSVFGDSLGALAGWAVAALVVAVLMLQRAVPAGTRYDAPTRRFHLAGSAVPLVLMMGIFFTKYGVGVMLAMHPALRHDAAFAIVVPTLYGVFSGVFAGRAIRLWTLALRQNRAPSTAHAA